ncbi:MULTISPECIES: hypothetical protein [Curtobacterium]|uniref:hypothetical protein n=1 Tax=Curtobacterium flaccumfaciens TaxID=2035 RepID=UPI003EE60668
MIGVECCSGDDVGHAVERDRLDQHAGDERDRSEPHPLEVLLGELEPLGRPDDAEVSAGRSRECLLRRLANEVPVALDLDATALGDGQQDVSCARPVRGVGDRPRRRSEERRGTSPARREAPGGFDHGDRVADRGLNVVAGDVEAAGGREHDRGPACSLDRGGDRRSGPAAADDGHSRCSHDVLPALYKCRG